MHVPESARGADTVSVHLRRDANDCRTVGVDEEWVTEREKSTGASTSTVTSLAETLVDRNHQHTHSEEIFELKFDLIIAF